MLVEAEEAWIHAALRLIIRRVAMERAGALPTAPLTVDDLPKPVNAPSAVTYRPRRRC
jgi:hypothetical protein